MTRRRISAVTSLLAVFAASGLVGAQPRRPERVTCSEKDIERAKKHAERAEMRRSLGELDQAVEEYTQAYKLCPKAGIAFNIAGLFWTRGLDEEKKGRPEAALASKKAAIPWYERVLQQQPRGDLSATAQEQLHATAEALFAANQREEALEVYRSYERLAPNGPHLGAVRARIAAISETRERLRAAEEAFRRGEAAFENRDWEQASQHFRRYQESRPDGPRAALVAKRLAAIAQVARESELAEEAFQSGEKAFEKRAWQRARDHYTKSRELAPEHARVGTIDERLAVTAKQLQQEKDFQEAKRRRILYRSSFWGAAGLAAASAVVASVSGLQMMGHEADKDDALDLYQFEHGQLALQGVCDEARDLLDAGDTAIEPLVSSCDQGRSAAARANIFWGASLVTAAVAGFLYYKGFVQKDKTRASMATTIEPSISGDTIGAVVTVRFF